MTSTLLAARALLAGLFLLVLPTDVAMCADLFRYTVRYDPFEVELTLPDGTKQTRSQNRSDASMLVTPKNGTACFTFALVIVSTGIIHLPRLQGSLVIETVL